LSDRHRIPSWFDSEMSTVKDDLTKVEQASKIKDDRMLWTFAQH